MVSQGNACLTRFADVRGTEIALHTVDGNSYRYRNSYRDGNGNCDHIAAAYAHATASADAAATSLALSGIRGTRENQLASSQLQSCSKSLTNAARVLYKGGGLHLEVS